MLIFIDESGIHKQDGQSTTALVYVKVAHIGSLDGAILQVEKDLKIEPFHWTKQSWKIRHVFLEAVIKEDFEVKIFVFTNPFTEEKMQNAWRHLLVEKDIRMVIIDGSKPRSYTLRLKQVLRHSGIPIKKIRMGNDKAFPCLRLADFFAGLSRAFADEPENQKAKELYKTAQIKITIQLMDGQVSVSPFR